MKFKNDTVEIRFQVIHRTLQEICNEMAEFCSENNQDFVITEARTTPEEDKALGRVSTSHREGRAVDIRTRDWPEEFRNAFLLEFDSRFGHFGAFTTHGNRRLLVFHDSGHGAHIHVQLDKTFSIKETT